MWDPMRTKWNFYHSHVYDTPDGQDCARKTFHMTKITGFFGALFGLFDAIGNPRTPPDTMGLSVGRVVTQTLPAAAIGAIFASTTCICAHISGQDTAINHMIGGCAAGTVYGARMHHGILACGGCLLGGALGGLTKIVKKHEYGIPLNTFKSNNYDFDSYRRHWGPAQPELKAPTDY